MGWFSCQKIKQSYIRRKRKNNLFCCLVTHFFSFFPSCTCANQAIIKGNKQEKVSFFPLRLIFYFLLGPHVLHDTHEIPLISAVVVKSSSPLEKRLDLGFSCWVVAAEDLWQNIFSARLKVMQGCQNKTDDGKRDPSWHFLGLVKSVRGATCLY